MKLKFGLSSLCAALALTAAFQARADIGFEIAPTIYTTGSSFLADGFLGTVSGPTTAFGLTGAIGSGPSGCFGLVCPGGNTGNFYVGLNDGRLALNRLDTRPFTISAFDTSFVLSTPIDFSTGQARLVVIGTAAQSGAQVSASFDLNGNSSGLRFQTLDLAGSVFDHLALSSVGFRSCLVTDIGDCVNPASNQAQFALDNIRVTAVPEPQTYALMGLGLGALGLRRRVLQRADCAGRQA